MRELAALPALLLALLISPAAAQPRLSVVGRAFQRGEMLLVVAEENDPRTAPTARFQDRDLDFFPAASTGTWLAFLGLDLDASTGPATLQAVLRDSKGRPSQWAETFTVGAGTFAVRELHVKQRYVTLSVRNADRAEDEAKKLHELFIHGEERRLFEGRFDSPIPNVATARFGERRVFNGQPRSPHSGMDLKAKAGTPVRAPAAARVALADPQHPLFFAGQTIVLDHGLGVTTMYAHLSQVLVKQGDLVRKGQMIGKVGRTGRVTGPHLHWGLKFHEARIDPFSLVWLDLDAYLKPRSFDPLQRSPACERKDLPPAPKWGRTVGGLRARLRPLKPVYARNEPVTLLVEIQNAGRGNEFLDFVRDPAARPVVLGFNRGPEPFSALASSATARLFTEQVKIRPKKILCFEQAQDAGGPLLARDTTSYVLSYATEYLYSSTTTARSGIWHGRLLSPPAAVVVSTAAVDAPPQAETPEDP